MHTRRWLWIWAASWLFAMGAEAQVTASDKATAEALFDRGITLLREGRLEEACARLEQSLAIEHGIGTMLYLAECYEKSGRTASAWALFREASSEAQAAGQSERAVAGRQRAERLEPSLSRLTVEVPDESRVPGLEVARNGTVIPMGVWGLPLPVDPGAQQLEARAPGFLPQQQVVTVEKGSTSAKATIARLDPAPVPAAVASAPAPAGPVQTTPAAAPAASAPTAAPADHGLSTQKLVGIIVGGTGVALLALGAGFGARANNKNGDAKDAGCHGKVCSDQRGVDLTDQAMTAARVADVGIIGGGALVAGGLITYFLAPRSDQTTTQVAFSADQRGAAVHVGGAF